MLAAKLLGGQVADLHRRDGGCTVLVGDRYQEPHRKGYAVSMFPDRTWRDTCRNLDPHTVEDWVVSQGEDVFQHPMMGVGTWWDGTYTWMDLVAVVPTKRLAIRLGRKYNQVAVYDLAHGAEVPCGGTGEPPAKLPSLRKRVWGDLPDVA
jgi:hypothetical protein